MKKSHNFSPKTHSSKTTAKSLHLINDEYNSFEHVINCLVTICEHSELQAEQCALLTHYKGSCEIAIGKDEDLIPIQEDLALYGLDVEIL
jgi:ATP-dependent Clp protease adaptor protein ClpS